MVRPGWCYVWRKITELSIIFSMSHHGSYCQSALLLVVTNLITWLRLLLGNIFIAYIYFLLDSCLLYWATKALSFWGYFPWWKFEGLQHYNCQISYRSGTSDWKFINEQLHRLNRWLNFSLGKHTDCRKGQIWLIERVKSHLEPTINCFVFFQRWETPLAISDLHPETYWIGNQHLSSDGWFQGRCCSPYKPPCRPTSASWCGRAIRGGKWGPWFLLFAMAVSHGVVAVIALCCRLFVRFR